MLLICAFAAAGAIEYFDPRPYNSNWHLHQDEARYMAGLEKYAHQVDEGKLGDIAMYRFGKHASHGAIIVSGDLIVHAHKRDGQVILCERSALADRLDSYWSVIS